MAELINSGNIVQKPEIVVDPSVFLPGGIVGARSKRKEEVPNPDDGLVTGEGAVFAPSGEPGSPGEPGPGPGEGGPPRVPVIQGLLPPSNISIESQTTKFSPDGAMNVDVVLVFEDILGATGYDVRITKSGDTQGVLVPADVTVTP